MSSKRTRTYHSFSSAETVALGKEVARVIAAKRSKDNALVVAMKGDLGAGKTTFVSGFFQGVGIKRRAPSPTFVIMRRHAVPKGRHARKGFKNLFHVDAYRLKKAKDLEPLEFMSILNEPSNIVLIEWAERTKEILPKDAVWLTFVHNGKRENERRIMIKHPSPRS